MKLSKLAKQWQKANILNLLHKTNLNRQGSLQWHSPNWVLVDTNTKPIRIEVLGDYPVAMEKLLKHL